VGFSDEDWFFLNVHSTVCIENATEDKNEELVVDMSEQVVIKIHDLISNTVYVMSVCAMTSVGHGAATSVSEVTQHPSRNSLLLAFHF